MKALQQKLHQLLLQLQIQLQTLHLLQMLALPKRWNGFDPKQKAMSLSDVAFFCALIVQPIGAKDLRRRYSAFSHALSL